MAVESLSTLSKASYPAQTGSVVVLGKTYTSVYSPEYIASLVSSPGSPELCHASKPNSAFKSRSVSAQSNTCLPHLEGVGKSHGLGAIGGRGGPVESKSAMVAAPVSRHDLQTSASRPSSDADTFSFSPCDRPLTQTPPPESSSAVADVPRKCKSAGRKKKVKGKKMNVTVKRKNSRNSNGSQQSMTITNTDSSTLSLTFHSLKDSLTASCKAVKLYEQDKKKTKTAAVLECPTTVSRKYSRGNQQPKITKLSKSLPMASTEDSLCVALLKPGARSRQGTTQPAISTTQSSQQFISRMLSHADQMVKKLTKVYLSDKNSGVLKECGMHIPCAPPATPTPEQLKHYEYVPSLTDLRAKRSIRQRLEAMERRAQSKLEQERLEFAKLEKLRKKEEEAVLRRKQRLEIYALNKIMTDLENQRFLEFCKVKNIS